jgi:hypothetical protein
MPPILNKSLLFDEPTDLFYCSSLVLKWSKMFALVGELPMIVGAFD